MVILNISHMLVIVRAGDILVKQAKISVPESQKWVRQANLEGEKCKVEPVGGQICFLFERISFFLYY